MKDKSVFSSSNIDTTLVDRVSHLESDADVAAFIEGGHLVKTLRNWTYFLTMNEHGYYINLLKKLVFITSVVNRYITADAESLDKSQLPIQLKVLEHKQAVVDFYVELIAAHMKTVYRAFAAKVSVFIHVAQLLYELVTFNHPTVMNDFLNAFDINHLAVVKILASRNHNARPHFVRFWLQFCNNVNSFTRKDLLLGRISNNLWKWMEHDPFEVWLQMFEFIKTKILHESSFKRATKCKILNENFLAKYSTIMAKVEEPVYEAHVKTACMDVFTVIATDLDAGLVFPQTDGGVVITVNARDFKINNKLLYTLLTFLKPWESHTHLVGATAVLRTNTELVAPYMHWIVASGGGYHDPTLSSWWIGHSLLYTHILSLELPDSVDAIALAPLSKGALLKCLELKKLLINQLALQLVHQMLDQLHARRQQTVELVLNAVPPLSAFIHFIKHENKIIRLSAVQIVRRYEHLRPLTITTLSTTVNDLINTQDLSSNYELILLDNYLAIQAANEEFKWYNKSASANSFFTNLVKLLTLDKLKQRIFAILVKMTEGSLLFNGDVIESPLWALVHHVNSMPESMFNVLDETVSRAVKFPYKYLDMAHADYADVSVFVVALIEQVKFVEQTPELAKWLEEFSTTLVTLGEPEAAFVKFGITVKVPKFSGVPINRTQFGQLAYHYRTLTKDDAIVETFTKMGNYLMSDPVGYMKSSRFWGPLMTHPLKAQLLSELYLQLAVEPPAEYRKYIFDQQAPFVWVLTDSQLTKLAFNYSAANLKHVYEEIARRNLTVTPDVSQLIDRPGFEAILLRYDVPLELIKGDLFKYQHLLLQVPADQLVSLTTTNKDLLYLLGLESLEFLHKNSEAVLPIALEFGDWRKSIRILLHYPKAAEGVLFRHVTPSTLKKTFMADFVDLVAKLEVLDDTKAWAHKATLYTSKKLAESAYPLSGSFLEFLDRFDTHIDKFRHVPVSLINTQLEIIFGNKNLVRDVGVLRHALHLITKAVQYGRSLQMLVNSEHSALTELPTLENREVRLVTGQLIHKLFHLHPAKNSNQLLLDSLLCLYLGSTRPEDMLLKEVIVAIEKTTTKSWVQRVVNWDFQDEMSANDIDLVGQERLIIRDKANFVVSVNKNFINNTLMGRKGYGYAETVYDSEFLLMLTISNPELVKEGETVAPNVRRLVESGLLQFVVTCLAHEHTSTIAQIIIHGVLKSIDAQDHKDKNIIKVYLSNALNTVRKPQLVHRLAIIWNVYGWVLPILVNPGHFLYEKAFRYVLSNPHVSEIPLFTAIAKPQVDESSDTLHDQYYRQVNWLLVNLANGTRTTEDIAVVRLKRLVEWAMNLHALAYAPEHTKHLVLRFVHSLQALGASTLVTRFAGLTNLELLAPRTDLEKLNVAQVAARYAAARTKRVAQWTGDDIHAIKRIRVNI